MEEASRERFMSTSRLQLGCRQMEAGSMISGQFAEEDEEGGAVGELFGVVNGRQTWGNTFVEPCEYRGKGWVLGGK